MLNLWKISAISAVLAAGFVVATDTPSVSRQSDVRLAVRSTGEIDGARCDVTGGWPFFDARCAGTSAPRKVRTVGLDRALDATGQYRVTEIAGPIVR